MKIETADLKVLAARTSQYPEDNLPEFLLVGRSNVGKSSFINTIVQKKNLAHTSATPGKTQTLNFYIINDRFYLVDAPGYGYAQVNRDKQKKFGLMIEEYLINRSNLKRVFLLVDFRHKPTEDDLLMFNFMKYYNLDVTIIATKYDKIKQKEKEKNEKILRETFDLREKDNIILFSSITKKGREEVYSLIENVIDTKM